jgi:ankyrin repeat protein
MNKLLLLVVLASTFIFPSFTLAQTLTRADSPVRKAAASNTAPSTKECRLSRLDGSLYEAAEDGEVMEINHLLDQGANVNCVIDGDGSPLIGAARNGRLEAVRLLLDRGADPNLAVPGDGNPLIMAARDGQSDVVTLLLDRGARIDEMVPGDENALIQASGSGQLSVVKLLVSRGADVNTRVWVDDTSWQKGEWRTPLSMARKGGHKAVMSFLLASGAKE